MVENDDKSQGHTPAPWSVEYSEKGADNFRIFGPDGGLLIGSCGCCGSPWLCGDNGPANAELISQAPALKARVQELEEQLEITTGTIEWLMEHHSKDLWEMIGGQGFGIIQDNAEAARAILPEKTTGEIIAMRHPMEPADG